MKDWKDKLSSRKFWICVAAFLGSIAASISGIATNNKYVTTIGIIAGVLSAAIYAFCEAWVDSTAVKKQFDEAVWISMFTSILNATHAPEKEEDVNASDGRTDNNND